MWNINTDYLCIAISGLSGCGNTSASKLLASTLEIAFINYTFRNLAKDYGTTFKEMRKMAEKEDIWDILVDTRQAELARTSSCVVGSRLAIWKIPSPSLKVYLEADEAVRTQRIHNREGGDITQVRLQTHERDIADYNRYLRLYQIDITQYKSQADLVIDANIIDVKTIVTSILSELEKKNLIIKT